MGPPPQLGVPPGSVQVVERPHVGAQRVPPTAGTRVATDEGYRCADSGEDPTQLYLVKDRLWRKAGMGPSGALCIPCLEKRLGRKLRPRDFLHGAPASRRALP